MGKTTHGLANHKLYRVWDGIKQRCYNPKNIAYKRYGAVGIIMSDEWKNDFKKFYDWAIDNGWKEGLEVDKDIICNKLKINPKLYSPETCMIVTPRVNGLNSSWTILDDDEIKEIADYIEKNENTYKSREDVCKKYNITKKQLNSIFNRRSKNTFNQRGKSGVLTMDLKIKITEMRELNIPYKTIGEKLSVNWSTVRGYWRKYLENKKCHIN